MLVETLLFSVENAFLWTWMSIKGQVPWYNNFFYGLILISVVVWLLEILLPWRREQSVFRKDFWLDALYMFFNFFVFAIAISGVYAVSGLLLSTIGITIDSFALIDLTQLHSVWQLVLFFVLLDFMQWVTHILLHSIPALWKFHQVHHSVNEMGFAAHLRYHWMENIFYKPVRTLGVMVLGGFEPEQAYIVYFFTLAIGHINHANIKITWGPFKYLLNNPVMHLYHHAYTLPKGSNGVNFGISLSIWDYIFKTHYIPEEGGKVELGFPGEERVPAGFAGQLIHGFTSRKK